MGFLKASLSGAVLIGLIILIRAVFIHKVPKKILMGFWGLAICRLLIPFSLPCPSIYQTLTGLVAIKLQNSIAWLKSVENVTLPLVSVTVTQVTQGDEILETGRVTLLIVGTILWIVAGVILFLIFISNHSKWCWKYRQALPVENSFVDEWVTIHNKRKRVRIRRSDQIMTPMVYGLWKPVILLPKWMDMDEAGQLSYVLTHEMMHIKHGDLWKKWAMLVTVCIHWFNPLVWVMFLLFNRDLELSCDEAVVAIYGPKAKAEYAYALIGMEEERMTFSPLFACFSKNVFEQRIKAIMSYKKYSIAAVSFTMILMLGIVLLFGFEGKVNRLAWEGDKQPGVAIISQSEDEIAYEVYTCLDGAQYRFFCTSTGDVSVEEEARQLQEQCDAYTQLGVYMDKETGWLCYEGFTIENLLDVREGRGICLGQSGLPGAVNLKTVYQDDTLIGFKISD